MPTNECSFAKFGDKKKAKYLELLRGGGRRSTSARACGVSPELVRLYRKATPEWAGLEEAAEMEANEAVENGLYKAAVGGNVVACQVWLYNRDPERWRDKRAVEHTGKDGAPLIDIRPMLEAMMRDANSYAAAKRLVSEPVNGNGNGNGNHN